MTFKKAVVKTTHLETAWKPGLRALRSEDRLHIEPEDPQRLTGSVDIDTALAPVYPHANRWDFAIGYRHADRKAEVIYWTELHTATDGEVRVVIAKTRWLLGWLKGAGKCLAKFEREIV